MDFSSPSNDRSRARVYDRLRFRLEQAVHLKDDEIERLKNELLLIKARSTLGHEDVYSRVSELRKKADSIRKKLFKAQTEHNIQMSKISYEHTERMREEDFNHSNALADIQAEQLKTPGSKTEVEQLIQDLYGFTKKPQKSQKLTTDTEDVYESKNESEQQTEDEIYIEDIQGDEEEEEENENEVNELEEKLVDLKQLLKERSEIIESSEDLHKAKIATLKNELEEQKQRKKLIQEKLKQIKKVVKNTRPQSFEELKADNLSLKRAIGQLDNIIYGRNGKYSKWRKIPDEYLSSLKLHS